MEQQRAEKTSYHLRFLTGAQVGSHIYGFKAGYTNLHHPLDRLEVGIGANQAVSVLLQSAAFEGVEQLRPATLTLTLGFFSLEKARRERTLPPPNSSSNKRELCESEEEEGRWMAGCVCLLR